MKLLCFPWSSDGTTIPGSGKTEGDPSVPAQAGTPLPKKSATPPDPPHRSGKVQMKLLCFRWSSDGTPTSGSGKRRGSPPLPARPGYPLSPKCGTP